MWSEVVMRYLTSRQSHLLHDHNKLTPATKSDAGSSSSHGKDTLRLPELVLRLKLWLRPSANRPRRHSQNDHIRSQDVVKKTRYERIQTWTTVATALTAIVALGLSAINYMQVNHRPTIQMMMPRVIRIAQGALTDLYIQPTFTVQKMTGVAGVISSVNVTLQGPVGTKEQKFYWVGTVEFAQDPNSFNYYNRYNGDPTPIIVTEANPQHSHLKFSTLDPAFTIGRWRGSLIADQQGQSPLVAPLCIDISKTDLQTIEGTAGKRYFNFRNDLPTDGTQAPNSGCYRSAF
jgi:hypothetical protein